jgi:hypothetical protein
VGSVYTEGEAVRFTVRTDADAYVLLFDIDTEGFVHLLYPRDAKSLQKFSAGVSHDIPAQADESLLVTGKTGMEFVFAVAVPNRDAISDREIGFLLDGETQPTHKKYRIDGDPFLAANRVAGQLVRGIRYSDDVTLAYTYFFVNEAVDYPRYLCEECYDKDTDPYEPDRPWVAGEALERHNGLHYPLAQAFEMSYDVGDNTSGYSAWPRYRDHYYPYYPYYGSSFYWSIGWAWDYYYYPSYYHHYSRYAWWWGNDWRRHNRHHGHRGYDVARRTMRPHQPSARKYKGKSPSSPRVSTVYKGRTARPLTVYKGKSSYKSRGTYGSYKARTRTVHTPRQQTYGKSRATRSRDYTGSKTIYRSRGKQVRRSNRPYQTRSSVKSHSMRGSRKPITFKRGTTRSRDSLSRNPSSFRSSRGRSSKFTGHSRTRSATRKSKSR